VGEAVAIVVARTKDEALDAAEAVEVEYEELPWVTHSEDALEGGKGAPSVWDEVPHNVLVDTIFGDREATEHAFFEADHVVKMKFHIGRCTAVALEPRSVLASYDASTGRYTLYAGSGGRGSLQERPRFAPRNRAAKPARHLPRRRRQFRVEKPRVRGVRTGALGLPQARRR